MHLIKKYLTLLIILFITNLTVAQKLYKEMMDDMNYNYFEVVEAAEDYFKNKPKGKGSGYKQYMRWKHENDGKYGLSGNRMNVDHLAAAKTFKKFTDEKKNAANKTNIQKSDWKDLGPYSSFFPHGKVYGIGRVECFWVNPDNDKEFAIGSRSGGFWKSVDGGITWKNTTDFLMATGVNIIAVNPLNHNEVLINIQSGKNGVSHGIYRSTDGGDTWEPTKFSPLNTDINFFPKKIYSINYHPKIKDMVFIGTELGVQRSTNNLTTWSKASKHKIRQIKFHPTLNNIIYAGSNATKSLIRSTDKGENFEELAPIPEFDSKNGKIAVSPDKPNNVWLASTDGIWKSTDKGNNFNFVANPKESCVAFAVSDEDETKQIYGYVNIWASQNGKEFELSSGNEDEKYVHVDLRVAECVNGVFYIGTDGYFAKSEDNGKTWIRLNEYGTSIRENYSFSISQSIDGYMTGGSQDNGNSIYRNQQWLQLGGGDGMESIIHPLNKNWRLTSIQNGFRYIRKEGNSSSSNYYRNHGDWQAPILFDPNDHMKLYNFTDSLHMSTDYEKNWAYIGSPNIGNVTKADIANNNSNYIMAAKDKVIKLSENAGRTWKNISDNYAFSSISDITFNPKNDSIIIVSCSNTYHKRGVYITYNLGETWQDITYNLGAMPIRDVAIDHTDENNIYVGAEIGVFTMPMNGSQWTLYNKALPNATVTELKINNGTNEIYAGTWGRGFWKTDLVGRSTYPKIVSTRITDTPTETTPEVGSHQIVTCKINYPFSLSKVEVKWSVNNLSFINSINMTYNPGNSTWVSDGALPTKNPGDKIYFKVFATGKNNDVSETYKFMYEVRGICDAAILSQIGNEFKGVKDKDFFGNNVDVNEDGSRIVIASLKYDYAGGVDNGLVQVFEQLNNNWVQVGNDIVGSSKKELGTGVSMASNGMRIAVGHKYNLDYTVVYELNGTNWMQLGNTIYSNNGKVKLSADGNTLLTSEHSDDTFGNNFGIVNVFEFDGDNWNKKGEAFSTPTARAVGFGKAIDISSDGNTIAISSYKDGTNTPAGGSVSMFKWNANNRNWQPLGNTIYGNVPSSYFGDALALNYDGSTVAIGSKKNHSAVYKLNNHVWEQVGDLIDSSFFLKDNFKIDISDDGKTVLLSNPAETVNGNKKYGAVANYQLSNESLTEAWYKVGNTIYGNENNKHFGSNAALSKNGKVSIIGGYNSDYKGYAKIYKPECLPQNTANDYCGVDENTLLLLPFNYSYEDVVDEEPPLSRKGVSIGKGYYDRSLNIMENAVSTSFKYEASNNINAQKGTIELWVKPNWNGNDGKGHTILQYGRVGGMLVLKDGANNLRLILNRYSPDRYPEVGVSKNIADWQANQWQHLAFTWGEGILQLFINGILVSQKKYTAPLYSIRQTSFNIGSDNGNLNWAGAIDHLRISNTIRSQSEIIDFKHNCIRPKLANHPNIKVFNFPNPFDGQTTISYILPQENQVTLTVYDGTGKQIAVLQKKETKPAGTHSINFKGNNYPPGIYYYTLRAGDFVKTQKMFLME